MDFMAKKGIKHQYKMPCTPQQNGVPERKNKSLMEMARCMLKAKGLPHKLWMEVVTCATHVLNRCPTKVLKTITPFEAWNDRKPSVDYMRVFGCLAYAHVLQQLRVVSLMIRQSNVFLWSILVIVKVTCFIILLHRIFLRVMM